MSERKVLNVSTFLLSGGYCIVPLRFSMYRNHHIPYFAEILSTGL